MLCSTNCFHACDPADKAQLCLFGSSKNGFGFHDSDLDICMTLEGHETAEVSVHTFTEGYFIGGIRNVLF